MNRLRFSNSNGQGLVEFALILLFLILLAFGVMDFARVFHATVAISSAAREGARYVTRHPDDLNGGRTAAVNEAQNAGISIPIAGITATCTDLNTNGYCDGGFPAIVTVNYQFRTMLGNLFTASPFTITRKAEMVVP